MPFEFEFIQGVQAKPSEEVHPSEATEPSDSMPPLSRQGGRKEGKREKEQGAAKQMSNPRARSAFVRGALKTRLDATMLKCASCIHQMKYFGDDDVEH
jgi:hypothetical protein